MNTDQKNYTNKWVEISSFYKLPMSNGVFKLYDLIKNWESLNHLNKLQKVEVKQFYYNTGSTSYSGAESYKLINHKSVENIYIIRFRNDGFGTQIFRWDGLVEEWEKYSTSIDKSNFVNSMDKSNIM